MQIAFYIFMFVTGAIFGSFLCCQAERMRMREEKLRHFSGRVARSRRHGARALHLALPRSGIPRNDAISLPSRSVCLHCHKKLRWHDSIPIISWLVLGGKCRFCHKKIGVAEIVSEIATAVALTAIATTVDVYTATPMEWGIFVAVVIFALILIFIAIYDGMYGEMPSSLLTLSIICAIIIVILQAGASFLVAGIFDFSVWRVVIQAVAAGALYGGIYLILLLASKGRWVGDGDWLLALSIGLALGTPWLAILSLFLANVSACLVMLPSIYRSKRRKSHQIYFGPFMVLAFVIIYTFADFCISVL